MRRSEKGWVLDLNLSNKQTDNLKALAARLGISPQAVFRTVLNNNNLERLENEIRSSTSTSR